MTIPNIDKILLAAFPLWDGEYLGCRSIQFTGNFLRDTVPEDLVTRLKADLPPDAMVYAPDGLVLRMSLGASNVGADRFLAVFSSRQWEERAPGADFIPLDIRWTCSAPKNVEVPHRIELMSFIDNGTYEIVIDKTRQIIQMPSERETENQLVLVIKSK